MSDSAFSILYAICELGDGCLQKDICRRAFLSKQTVHSSIRNLERDGLLYLEHGRRRDMHIHLTEAGARLARSRIAAWSKAPFWKWTRRSSRRFCGRRRNTPTCSAGRWNNF